MQTKRLPSRAAGGAAAGVAFEAGAVSDQGEAATFGAHVADIALGLGLSPEFRP